MDFYNPAAVKNPIATGAQPLSASAPSANGVPYSLPTGPNPNKVGYLDTEQLGSGQFGTGGSFQGAGRVGALQALYGTQSTANPADMNNLDSLRSYYSNALNDLPGQTADKVSTFDTQAQRGLKNMLSQYSNSQAGTGRLGSRQFSGAQGDITSKANSDYMTGLLNARSDAITQAGKIGSGMTGVQDENMKERQFQLDQGQRVSDMLYKLMALDKNSPDVNAQRAAQDKQNTMDLIKSGATLGTYAVA